MTSSRSRVCKHVEGSENENGVRLLIQKSPRSSVNAFPFARLE